MGLSLGVKKVFNVEEGKDWNTATTQSRVGLGRKGKRGYPSQRKRVKQRAVLRSEV